MPLANKLQIPIAVAENNVGKRILADVYAYTVVD
jgi:hypothetical protein